MDELFKKKSDLYVRFLLFGSAGRCITPLEVRGTSVPRANDRRSRKGRCDSGGGKAQAPHRPVEPKVSPAWSCQPQARSSGNKGAATARCKAGLRPRTAQDLPGDSGSDPFRHPVPTVKSTSVHGKARHLRRGEPERRPRSATRTCNSTRTGYHPVSHASPTTRGARTSIEEGPPGASLRGRRGPQGRSGLTFARVRSVCAHPMSFGPAQKASLRRGSGFGWRGLGLEPGCRGIARSSLRHVGPAGSSCKGGGSGLRQKRNDGRQRAQGSPLRRARIELAETRPCVVFENSLQKSKGFVWLEEASCVDMKAGRERGPRVGSHPRRQTAGWNPVDSKGRSARSRGGKTARTEQARGQRAKSRMTARRGVARRRADEEAPLDRRRAGSQRGGFFTEPPPNDLGVILGRGPLGERSLKPAYRGWRDRRVRGSADGERTEEENASTFER